MRTTLLIGAMLVAATAIAPAAIADHEDDSDVNVQDEYYVLVSGLEVQIWEETNGHDGLQTGRVVVGGEILPSDDRIA